MNIFTAVKYCCILYGHVCVMCLCNRCFFADCQSLEKHVTRKTNFALYKRRNISLYRFLCVWQTINQLCWSVFCKHIQLQSGNCDAKYGKSRYLSVALKSYILGLFDDTEQKPRTPWYCVYYRMCSIIFSDRIGT